MEPRSTLRAARPIHQLAQYLPNEHMIRRLPLLAVILMTGCAAVPGRPPGAESAWKPEITIRAEKPLVRDGMDARPPGFCAKPGYDVYYLARKPFKEL